MSANVPKKVICMVTEVSPNEDLIHVSMLDGTNMINGHFDMALAGLEEHLSGTEKKPVVKARINHEGIPYGGDRVEITYYPTKDAEYVGVEWKWAN